MKKLTSKVILVAIAIFAVMCLASRVFASDLLIVDDGANNTATSNTSLNSLTSLNNNTSKNMTASSILNSSNTANKSTYNNATNTALPKTGSDYTLSIVLFACVASAAYAFIKIRNYKNI